MIVPSMTEQEIREELLKDLADLDKPMERFRKNVRVSKEKIFLS